MRMLHKHIDTYTNTTMQTNTQAYSPNISNISIYACIYLSNLCLETLGQKENNMMYYTI